MKEKKNKNIKKEIILSVRNLSKNYRDYDKYLEVLKGLNLDIYKGEIIAITGPSGSGKTTFLNCISTIDSFDDGEVIFDGKNISSMSEKEKNKFRSYNMGFVFQNYNLISVLSALENVQLSLSNKKEHLLNSIQISKEILEKVGLGDRLHNKPDQLSGGEKQRVAIARALVHKPKIVFADEPTGNLDSKSSEDIMNLILQMNQEYGVTFVIVTHNSMVASKAHRVFRLKNGKLEKV
ncbi:MAG: ABC transporter ATP-binding protein [Candidatus Dojkabacteria bacterium]|nr:ABC transporter ATP-binding protein [Candidatus Dojkabacteria bacterium]